MRDPRIGALLLLLLALPACAAPEPAPGGEAPAAAADPGGFRDAFAVDPADWATRGTGRYFVLEPGFVLELAGEEEGEEVRLVVAVLDETRTVAGVETRVVEERETKGGVLCEVSRNFLAFSKRDRGVYYFGEEVDDYEDGKPAGHAGAWLAGEAGARWGLLVPGDPRPGDRYCQEVAPGVAMDRAEVLSLDAVLETPAGRFEGCLEVLETTPLGRGAEKKVHAPGVGLARDGGLLLVRYGPRPK